MHDDIRPAESKLRSPQDQFRRVDRFLLGCAPLGKCYQAVGQLLGDQGGFLSLIQPIVLRAVLIERGQAEGNIPHDGRQQVVVVVGNPARQRRNRLQLPRFEQLFLDTPTLGVVTDDEQFTEAFFEGQGTGNKLDIDPAPVACFQPRITVNQPVLLRLIQHTALVIRIVGLKIDVRGLRPQFRLGVTGHRTKRLVGVHRTVIAQNHESIMQMAANQAKNPIVRHIPVPGGSVHMVG